MSWKTDILQRNITKLSNKQAYFRTHWSQTAKLWKHARQFKQHQSPASPSPLKAWKASQAEMVDGVCPPTTLHLDKTPAASSEKGQPFLVSAKGVA